MYSVVGIPIVWIADATAKSMKERLFNMNKKHVHEYVLGQSGKIVTCYCGKFRFICECCGDLPKHCGCLGPAQIEIITEVQ